MDLAKYPPKAFPITTMLYFLKLSALYTESYSNRFNILLYKKYRIKWILDDCIPR